LPTLLNPETDLTCSCCAVADPIQPKAATIKKPVYFIL